MAQSQTLDDEVKTRVPAEMKRKVEEEARRRELGSSDIVREALREYFANRDPKTGKRRVAA